mmetsp:Transcript_25198/g.66980  ORF Transcript_25198/g.66980 Transcript_25198/m.66980 type:complete len:335 (-) Transcript_25198:260-1264(-)
MRGASRPKPPPPPLPRTYLEQDMNEIPPSRFWPFATKLTSIPHCTERRNRDSGAQGRPKAAEQNGPSIGRGGSMWVPRRSPVEVELADPASSTSDSQALSMPLPSSRRPPPATARGTSSVGSLSVGGQRPVAPSDLQQASRTQTPAHRQLPPSAKAAPHVATPTCGESRSSSSWEGARPHDRGNRRSERLIEEALREFGGVADRDELIELDDQGLLTRVPRNHAGSLSSVGSIDHAPGKCTPCAYWYKGICKYGIMCLYCHFAHEGQRALRLRPSKQTRLRIKKREEEAAAASAALAAAACAGDIDEAAMATAVVVAAVADLAELFEEEEIGEL